MDMKRIGWVIAGAIVFAVAIGNYVLDLNGSGLPAGFASGNGRVEADQINVSTLLPGRVSEIRVTEGSLVQAGDVLAIMDTSELQSQLARAQAESARAESLIDEVRALIHQREADLVLVRDEFARASQLAERGVQSTAVADQAQARLASAEAALEAATAQLHSAKRGAEAAAALVAQTETQIANATLKAPVFGRVLYRLAQPGEVLSAGGRVVTLIDMTQVYMDIFLPSADTMRTPMGAEARITLDSIDYAIPAFVSFVSPEAQFTPRTVETSEARADLMFRIRVRVPEELVRANINQVRTGLRGIATVRLSGEESKPWPVEIVGQPIPSGSVATE